MCGIVGRYNFDGTIVREDTVMKMADSIYHRGPDDKGYFIENNIGLGMRRLSIIDVAGGHQPVFNEDKSICVVYNGEIYNYRQLTAELQSKGHLFSTHSDTEILVHGYEEYGISFVKQLNGMFAFALWDKEREKLFIVRDRVGIKPLSYYMDEKKIIFGSEIKSIISNQDVQVEPNESAIADYLIKGKYLFTQTFFKNIYHLPAGHFMEICPTGIQTRQYWDFTFRAANGVSESEILRSLSNAIDESVKSQLMSEVPIGSYLSGGIDSSSVAVAAAKASPNRINTFSAVFPGHDAFNEDEYQKEIVKTSNVEHHENKLTEDDFLEDLEKMIWHIEQPMAGISIGQYQMARFTKKWVTVVLTGHGGDELFGGYPNHLIGAFMDGLAINWLKPSAWKKTYGEMRLIAQEIGVVKTVYNIILFAKPFPLLRKWVLKIYESRKANDYFTKEYLQRNSNHFAHQIIFDLLITSNAKTWVDRMLYVDIKLWLQNILMVEDKESMAHSLEDRVPLLDNRVIEISEQMPSATKIKNLILKSGMRNALKGTLPDNLLAHRKMGFPQPVGEWVKDDRYRNSVKTKLISGELVGRKIIKQDYMEKLYEDHFLHNIDRTFDVWQLLCVEMWYTAYFKNIYKSPKTT